MAYEFTALDRSVQSGLRRIAGEELDRAAAIAGGAACKGDPVHEIRKSIKRTRALLRLARHSRPALEADDRLLRDIAAGLAPFRNREIGRRLLATLGAEAGLDRAALASLAGALGSGGADARDLPPALAAARPLLARAAARAARWKIDGHGFAALAPPLAATLRKARKLGRPGGKTVSAEAVHDWRKAVKAHWYHAQLMRQIWPEMLAAYASALDRLAETLGAYQDHAVLIDLLARAAPQDLAREVATLARRHQAGLLAAARDSAALLLAEPPRALVDRWGLWWNNAAPRLPRR